MEKRKSSIAHLPTDFVVDVQFREVDSAAAGAAAGSGAAATTSSSTADARRGSASSRPRGSSVSAASIPSVTGKHGWVMHTSTHWLFGH